MTAALFVEMVNARRTGAGKWQARCPAHDDSSPSLSIAEGTDGRILVRCWAGCATASILAAMGLTMRDLFAGATLTSEQRADATRQRTIRDAEQGRQHAIDRGQRDRVFKLGQLVDALGAKLARSPDDRELGRLFHLVCDRWHEAEAAMPHHEDGPLRLPEPSAIPGWIGDALVELGRNFDEGKGPLDAGLERIA